MTTVINATAREERTQHYGNAMRDLILAARKEGIEIRTRQMEEDPKPNDIPETRHHSLFSVPTDSSFSLFGLFYVEVATMTKP